MAAAPGAVFVSYRRKDTGHAAARIGDQLIDALGRDDVFMDVDTIRPGEDFIARIVQAAGSCRVLLALIGTQWTTVADRHGRRLDDPADIVALEIATALECGATVIPVLVDGAEMPREADLPLRLKPLVRRNAQRVDQATFRHAVAALLEEVRRILDTPPPLVRPAPARSELVGARPAPDRRRWTHLGAVVGVLVALSGAAVALLNNPDKDDDGRAVEPDSAAPTTVTLQPVEDRGSTVRLTWTGPENLDYAVTVAPEGQNAAPSLAGRVSTATVAVDPAGRYCVRVSATDGGTIVSSNVQPVRGASCPPA